MNILLPPYQNLLQITKMEARYHTGTPESNPKLLPKVLILTIENEQND